LFLLFLFVLIFALAKWKQKEATQYIIYSDGQEQIVFISCPLAPSYYVVTFFTGLLFIALLCHGLMVLSQKQHLTHAARSLFCVIRLEETQGARKLGRTLDPSVLIL
jgi:hypothetical protein